MTEASIRHVDAIEAERLIQQGGLQILDVRTPEEHEHIGHIFGSRLLPVSLIASAPSILDRDGTPVLVYCEHGIRSRTAAEWLVRAGFDSILNLSGGMSAWHGDRAFGPTPVSGPTSWLLDNADLLRDRRTALDIAAGRGRHALLLAAAGLVVHAIDADRKKMSELAETAARLGLPVRADVVDLEAGDIDLGTGLYDLVIVVHYLHRPLFPAIVRALAPGGVLLYETFTVHQIGRGRPNNRAFLLESGELPALVAPLVVTRAREGDFDGRMVAAVAAVKR